MAGRSTSWLQANLLLGRVRAERVLPPPDALTQTRRRQLLQLAALGMVASAAPWALVMLWRQSWGAATCYVAVLVGGALLWLCASRQHDRLALLLLSLSAWTAIAGVAIWVDRPSAELPRGVQCFVLPLLLLQRCLLAESSRWRRWPVLLISLLVFVLCSALPDLADGPPLLSPTDRLAGLVMAVLGSFALSLGVLRLQASELRGRAGLGLELAQAIANDTLELHLQPQLDADRRLLGAEALLRWSHPRLGELSAAPLLELAERHRLLQPLSDWALRRALQLAQSWVAPSPLATLPIALNLSATQLGDAASVERLLQHVAAAGLAPGRLRLELAESLCAAEDPELPARLQRCRDSGLPTALDDFGSGHSSLAYLSRLPFDQLKIDQRFIQDLEREPRHQHVTAAVLQLGRELGMSVLAKGVETQAQLDTLLRLGCRHFQGRWFCAPLAPAAFERWVLERQA